VLTPSIVAEPESNKLYESVSTKLPVANYKLPSIKINTFSGNVTEFPSWEIAFDALIEQQVTSVHVKLNLLSQHLHGEARSLVIGLLSNQTEHAYLAARARLKERYGSPSIINQAFMSKLDDWPQIKVGQPKELQQFSDFLTQIMEIRKVARGSLKILDFPQETRKILAKLPFYFENEWRKAVNEWRNTHGISSYPDYDFLVAFIEQRSQQANIPELQFIARSSTTNKMNPQQQNRQGNKSAKSFSTKLEKQDLLKVKCAYCSNDHSVNDCDKFLLLNRDDAFKYLSEHKLCFGCGDGEDHISRDCKSRCLCAKCGKTHLTALHLEKETIDATSKCTEVCGTDTKCYDNSMILPVRIRSKKTPSREILCYCILDEQSNACFMSDELKDQLNCASSTVNLTLSTVYKSKAVISSEKVEDLEILSFNQDECIALPAVFTRECIPASSSQIPKPEVAKKWPHLIPIADKIAPFQPDLKVSLLIGNNVPRVVRPREVIFGGEDEPYAQRSLLGWGVIGVVCRKSSSGNVVSHRVMLQNQMQPLELDSCCPSFAFSTKAKEVIEPKAVKQMFEMDFNECAGKSMSVDDQQFLSLLNSEVEKHPDGRYVIPLPIKCDSIGLPNSRPLAFKRLMQLKRRFGNNPKFKQDYNVFMQDMIQNFAEKVPDNELLDESQTVNYIPHSGVYHPKKPNKIRVVFDCSAEFGGTCLNDQLLTGPNLLADLLAVFCSFRKERIALVADIQNMFLRFYVRKKDRNFLRFLWWEDGDPTKPIQEYRMMVHLFGAVSSSGCANFGLKRAADDGEQEFGSKAAEFVRNHFYMDDGLISLPTKEEAISLAKDGIGLCKKAGLRLHKFLSNERDVLESIPETERAQSIRNLDIQMDPLPFERTLGIVWCVENDSFQFRVELKDVPLTRRGILSTVSSIFDPVGFVAPFVCNSCAKMEQNGMIQFLSIWP